MYKCSKCNKGVIVEGVQVPIRGCDCTQEVVVDGKVTVKPAAIIADMEGTAYGKSQFKN